MSLSCLGTCKAGKARGADVRLALTTLWCVIHIPPRTQGRCPRPVSRQRNTSGVHRQQSVIIELDSETGALHCTAVSYTIPPCELSGGFERSQYLDTPLSGARRSKIESPRLRSVSPAGIAGPYFEAGLERQASEANLVSGTTEK